MSRSFAVISLLLLTLSGCKKAPPTPQGVDENVKPGGRDDDEREGKDEEENEDEDDVLPRFWKVEVAIEGKGMVHSTRFDIHCWKPEADQPQQGKCGPQSWVTGLSGHAKPPSILAARPAPGWKLVAWRARVREPDGRVWARKLKAGGRPLYWNRFGSDKDTGQVELVTAVFTQAEPAGKVDASVDAPNEGG